MYSIFVDNCQSTSLNLSIKFDKSRDYKLITDFINKNADKCFEIQEIKPTVAQTFFLMKVLTALDKVNLYGNKARQKPEQPSALLFIIE